MALETTNDKVPEKTLAEPTTDWSVVSGGKKSPKDPKKEPKSSKKSSTLIKRLNGS
jgi:hypothetical protein